MIVIKNKQSIIKMRKAGQLLAAMFDGLKQVIVPGVTTLDIDNWIASYLQTNGLVSRSRGYHGYKHSSCVSINDEVIHGVPRADRVVQDGDVVKVDVCASYKGYCADMARCFLVGAVDSKAIHLVNVAQRALDKGIEQACAHNHFGDISAKIQQEVEHHGYGVLRDYAGHGIGKQMHEDPEILNYGKAGTGAVIRPGMTFAIEPMITQGDYAVRVSNDGWTVKTVDNSLAAHVEDTVLVTEHGPEILTRPSSIAGVV